MVILYLEPYVIGWEYKSAHTALNDLNIAIQLESQYSRVDQINFFKGCLPQILLCPLLNTWTHFAKKSVWQKGHINKAMSIIISLKVIDFQTSLQKK